MLAAEKLLRRGVEEGVFPYAEWALFDRNGIAVSYTHLTLPTILLV